MAERSKALTSLSWTGVVWARIPLETYIFILNFFAPSPFRTGQRSRCKWNQACPFTWSHSCFRPQIRFIIQGFVYSYLQYSFKYTFLTSMLKPVRTHINLRYCYTLYFISLCTYYTSDECHAWFHLYGLCRAVRNGKQANFSSWQYTCTMYVSRGIQTRNLSHDRLDHSVTD